MIQGCYSDVQPQLDQAHSMLIQLNLNITVAPLQI